MKKIKVGLSTFCFLVASIAMFSVGLFGRSTSLLCIIAGVLFLCAAILNVIDFSKKGANKN